MAKKEPFLLVGLGNPGKEFQDTYHNIGYLILQNIVEKEGKNWSNQKNVNGRVSKFNWNNQEVVFLLPETFMNKSGEAVQAVAKYWKIKPQNIIVIHDDSDIELEKIKIAKNQSSGGHKGVENIIKTLKTKEFGRLKIGVRKQVPKRQKAEIFILKKVSPKHKKELVKRGSEIMEVWVKEGMEQAMNKFH